MRRVEHARALIRAGISPGRFRALLKILRAWRSQVIGPTEPRLSVDRHKVRLTLPSGCHEPVDSDGMERHEGGDDGTEPRLSRWLDAREDRVSQRVLRIPSVSFRFPPPPPISLSAISGRCAWSVQRARVQNAQPLWRGGAAAPRALVRAWSTPLQVVERTGDSRWERQGC